MFLGGVVGEYFIVDCGVGGGGAGGLFAEFAFELFIGLFVLLNLAMQAAVGLFELGEGCISIFVLWLFFGIGLSGGEGGDECGVFGGDVFGEGVDELRGDFCF